MRRGTGEWQQFVFKIVDNHLQCLSLKEVCMTNTVYARLKYSVHAYQ